jgi:hypothetical protein
MDGDMWGYVGLCGAMWGYVGLCGARWDLLGVSRRKVKKFYYFIWIFSTSTSILYFTVPSSVKTTNNFFNEWNFS